ACVAGNDGQPDREGGSASLAVAGGRDRPAVRLDQMLDDREPEPETAVAACRRAVRLSERLEYVRQELGPDALPRVGHRPLHAVGGALQADADGTAVLRELHGGG